MTEDHRSLDGEIDLRFKDGSLVEWTEEMGGLEYGILVKRGRDKFVIFWSRSGVDEKNVWNISDIESALFAEDLVVVIL